MIHRRKGRRLKRTSSHRNATLANLAVSLIKHKKIRTTAAKAKELKVYVESLVTKARKTLGSAERDNGFGVHQRRQVNTYLRDRSAVKTLFDEIAPKVADRPGGYTRVLKMGRRFGDAAELALIEFVDYNVEQAEPKAKEKASASETKTSGKKKTKKSASAEKTPKKKKAKEETVE
jgi:large subunit ribosomal protein L17